MDKQIQYKKIKQACEILELGEKASSEKIKSNFYRLCHKWHPDKYKSSKKKANEMIQKIKEAYDIIMDYCNNYEYSFKDDDIERSVSYEELWNRQFGDDPHWGGSNNK